MLIWALDTATVMGFSAGQAGAIPRSGSVRLKRRDDPPEVAAFNALCFLRDQWTLERPDLVCVEHFLNPVGQKSADAIILQLQVYGVVAALAQAYQAMFGSVHRATLLKHFIGVGRTGDRAETKRQVIRRAIALGYVPADCRDADRCDACAVFDYAAATFARRPPKELVLFGESAS